MTPTQTAAFGTNPAPPTLCETVARIFLVLFAVAFLFAQPEPASASTDGPVVHIVSPVDGQAVAGGLLPVVVDFSAKLNSKGQPSGNVTHVDLLVNGHVVAVYQNPPNIKSGTHTFVVDLSQFGSGPIQISAVAYQGEGSSAPSQSSSGVTVQFDTIPPDITGATPANGSLGIAGSVEVRADLFDAGSGIDSPATRLTLDGADVTSSSTRTTSRISYMAAGLLDGPHAAKVDTADRAGNPAHLEWGFFLDLTDPVDVFTQPAEDVTVSTGRPMLTLTYSDPTANGYASGIDPATLEWFEDGRDVTSEAVVGADSATYTPPADRPLSEGEHHYLAIVHDRAGRTHSAVRVITVHIAPPPSVAIVLPGAITPLYAPAYLFTYSGTAPVTPTFARINGVDVLDRFQVTDTFAGYIPAVGDPVFLHAGPNLFEVGVVDGLGVAASASKIIGLVSGPGPATVPLVLTLKTGIALHALSHRPTPLIELVAQAGLGGAAVPGVALSAEFPGGFVQPAPPLSLNTSDLGFAGLYGVPGALTGTENSEIVHLTIRAKDYPDATPLDVPVTVYRPSLDVTFSVPERSEDSAQVFDEKIAVGASSHLVSARLTGAGVAGAEATVRFEIGRGTGADFVPDATLGEWMPEEVFREMGADCNSSLFVLAPADAATVRISAPEFPESGVKEYSVALVAKRGRVIDISTALPEGGFADTFPTVPIGSPFKSGNGQIVVHNGTLGTPLVLDLRGYNAAMRDTGAGAPYFSIYYTLLGPGHALPSSPYDWAMHVDSLGADEVALPILPSVSFEPAQMLLLYIIGSTADNGGGVFASIEAWEVGNLGPAEVKVVRHLDGEWQDSDIPYPDPWTIDLDPIADEMQFAVEAWLPAGTSASGAYANLQALDELVEPQADDASNPPVARQINFVSSEAGPSERYAILRTQGLRALAEPRNVMHLRAARLAAASSMGGVGGVTEIFGIPAAEDLDDLPASVVRTGKMLNITLKIEGSATTAEARTAEAAQIYHPSVNDAKRIGNERTNLVAGEFFSLTVGVPEEKALGKGTGFATSIRIADDVEGAANQDKLVEWNGREILGKPWFSGFVSEGAAYSTIPKADLGLSFVLVLKPRAPEGETFRNFHVINQDIAFGSGKTPVPTYDPDHLVPRDNLGNPESRAFRVGPALKKLNVALHFVSDEWKEADAVQALQIANQILKQCCIGLSRVELTDAQKQADSQLKEDATSRALPDNHIDEFRAALIENETTENIFLVKSIKIATVGTAVGLTEDDREGPLGQSKPTHRGWCYLRRNLPLNTVSLTTRNLGQAIAHESLHIMGFFSDSDFSKGVYDLYPDTLVKSVIDAAGEEFYKEGYKKKECLMWSNSADTGVIPDADCIFVRTHPRLR